MTQCDKVAEQLSGFIDGELTQQKAQEISLHIDDCDSCRQLYTELLSIQSDIKTIQIDADEAVELDKIMQDSGTHQTQQWGWLFFVSGASMLLMYSCYMFFINTELNSFEKFALGFISLGGLLLLISVIRQRLIASKTDKYKDINL